MCVRILRARIAEEDAPRTPLEPPHDCIICSDRLYQMMRRHRAEP